MLRNSQNWFWVVLFFPKNFSTRFLRQKSFESVLRLYSAITSWKKSERFHALSLQISRSLILNPFWPKNFKIKFFPKSFLSQFWTFISMQLHGKYQKIIGNTPQKNHFWPLLGDFWYKRPKTIFFHKKSIRLILGLYASLSLGKKVPENLQGPIFHKTWKTSFLGPFLEPLSPKNFKKKFSPKNNHLIQF